MKRLITAAMIAAALFSAGTQAQAITEKEKQEGFVSIFNGKDISGWTGDTKGYAVENGDLVCHGKNIYTVVKYSDFDFRFEFKLTPGANNGLAIRAPGHGDPAYNGMEIQILDDTSPKYAKLHEYQYHGSVYGLVPAKRGHLKPLGEWNSEEVIAIGHHIKIILNGVTIVDADVSKVKGNPPQHSLKKHQGRLNTEGFIGFLGHGAPVRFRNIRVKEIAAPKTSAAPKGFTALFNGSDLSGWKGLLKRPYDNPEKRAELSAQQKEKLQKEADELMRRHWKVKDGNLLYDGKGSSLCTARDYTDFEMLVDWKIEKGGDSGIYLRGAPQVQIWDRPPIGSGGLYNNKKHPSKPLLVADNPIGSWNTFRIKMVGEKVTVHLNGKLITDTIMENYWNRSIPIFPTGQIELQHHGSHLAFRNIYIREIRKTTPATRQ